MCRRGKDGGAFAGATDRDAGRTLEGSGRVSGGQDEGDCAGMGGSGGGVKKKGNGRGLTGVRTGVGEWGEQLERVG